MFGNPQFGYVTSLVTRFARHPGMSHRNTSDLRNAVCAAFLLAMLSPLAWPQNDSLARATAPLHLQSADELTEAGRLIEGKKYDEAETTVRAYLKQDPGSAKGHFLLGLIYFFEVRPKESLAEYTSGAKFATPAAFDLKIVGLDYVLLDDYNDAEKWLRQSTTRNPSDAEAWYSLGRVEYTLNHFDNAAKAFHQSLDLKPDSVKAEDNLGLTLAALNRPADAIDAWRKAIAMQSSAQHPSEQPLLNLGTTLIDQNEAQEAGSLLEQAATIAPENPKIQEQLGRAYLQLNQLDLAARHLERAVSLSPGDGKLHFQLGQVYRKLGLAEKAKVEFARTEALNGAKSNHP
jgi:tetratricopeptide (TPR) repeat protein